MSVHIQAITFDPEGVEVIYAEESDIMDNGLRIFKTAVIPRSLIVEQLQELEEAAEAIVDEITVIRRAPEATFSRSGFRG